MTSFFLSWRDYFSLGPLLILFIGALLVVFLESCRIKKPLFLIAVATLSCALFLQSAAPDINNPLLTPWIISDQLSHKAALLFLITGLGAVCLSYSFFQKFKASQGEYFFLILSSLMGLLLIGSSSDFLTFFLGIETLSLSLYILCGYMKKWAFSSESAIKYFLLGSISSAILLFGIAFIYGATGSTYFPVIQSTYDVTNLFQSTLLTIGFALVIVSLFFKAAIVPFHIWAPDVYTGAPTPITAFMTTATKVGVFVFLIRLFFYVIPQSYDRTLIYTSMTFCIYLTLIYGNLVACTQTNVRRLFAYSSISHAGFLLIPIAVGGEALASTTAIFFYLIIYIMATLGAFAIFTTEEEKPEGLNINDIRGLFYRAPLRTIILSIFLLTLAGIPPTIGFFTKFYVLQIAFNQGYMSLVILGLLTTVISAFYYVRLISLLFIDNNTVIYTSNFKKC